MTGFVLPEKYSEDLVDENGAKMSKRYDGMRMGGGLFRERGNGGTETSPTAARGLAGHLQRVTDVVSSSGRPLHDPITILSPHETRDTSTVSSRSA